MGVSSWEKSPTWGAVGAELEGAADAEHAKPIEVRGTWDMVSPEGGERGSVRIQIVDKEM
jgi:hypothetical protein